MRVGSEDGVEVVGAGAGGEGDCGEVGGGLGMGSSVDVFRGGDLEKVLV